MASQSLDHFVVPVDDIVVAEEFYTRIFDGVITKRNGLNTRQRKRGAVPHTFIQIGGKRMGVYLQSEERPLPTGPSGLPNYSFTSTAQGLDAVVMVCASSMPNISVPLAAVSAARQLLLEVRRSGCDRDYFARQSEFAEAESWYKDLGSASE